MMEPELPSLTDAQRRKVAVRSIFKPLNVLTLVAGLGVFFTTTLWWILPVTLAIYAVVVYLAMRDPIFVRRVIEKKSPQTNAPASGRRDMTPERRARWLPRGETREKVEAALVTYRKVLLAIEESDDVTRRVLEDSVPKLHVAAERLVDVAEKRERAAATLSDFDDRTESPQDEEPDQRESSLVGLEAHVEKADVEISSLSEQLLTLRAQVVRASMDSAGASQQASSINSSLDELNFRLEALNETLTAQN